MSTSYDRYPYVEVIGHDNECWSGWPTVCEEIRRTATAVLSEKGRAVIAIDCYTGIHERELRDAFAQYLKPDHILDTHSAFRSTEQIEKLIAPYMGGDDPIFGYMAPLELAEFLDPEKQSQLRQQVADLSGLVVVMGTGAQLCCEPDIIIYADMPRWEEQLRQRRDEVSNLGMNNADLKASLQYKQSYFVDWRVCDRVKQATMDRWDYLLDTTIPGEPKLVAGDAFRDALEQTVRRPFSVAPLFDPAPWGGQWLKSACNLEPPEYDGINYGWSFHCIPEENSLYLRFGTTVVEIPSSDVTFYRPRKLLGDNIYDMLGAEFPIRHDFLDTMEGGHLSWQVHPKLAQAHEEFGLMYTQDESYYMLDADEDASVFLGVKKGVDPEDMLSALERAQAGEEKFDEDRYTVRWPAKKHDHFLIPAGTMHSSGVNGMVLEISSTPYIFTFKLWDWARPGLDGLPRPINIERGRKAIDWSRTEEWTKANLINHFEPLASGDGWSEERTGQHELEILENRRYWFTGLTPHDTEGRLNVFTVVEGEEVIVESPSGAFSPFVVHYAETVIIPAAVGPYTTRPHGPAVGKKCGIMKTYVRDDGPGVEAVRQLAASKQTNHT